MKLEIQIIRMVFAAAVGFIIFLMVGIKQSMPAGSPQTGGGSQEITCSDYDQIISVPMAGFYTFLYCPADSLTWNPFNEEWKEPSTYQRRRIDQHQKAMRRRKE